LVSGPVEPESAPKVVEDASSNSLPG
jgi:hypothetical protein